MAKKKDEFSQLAYISIVESAANTLTFNGLSVFSNLLEPKGLVVHRLQYNVASQALLVAADDSMSFGLAGSDSITALSLDDPQIYDMEELVRRDLGTAGSGFYVSTMYIKDLSELPGGGMLVPADRVYGFVAGSSLASAVTVRIRMHFTVLDLTPQQYLELAQTLRVLT